MRDLVRALNIIATNAAIVWGTERAGLGLPEALFLYWFEGLIASILVLHLIIRHRSVTRKQGHYRPTSFFLRQRSAAIAALLPALLLCGFALSLPEQAATLTTSTIQELGSIGAAVFLFQVIPYCADSAGIGNRTFGWITGRAQSRTGENLIILLSIAAGTAVYAVVPVGIAALIVIAVIKSLLEFVILAATLNPRELSDKPPLLLRWIIRNKSEAERAEELAEWCAIRERAIAAADAGETVMPSKPGSQSTNAK